MARPFKYDWEKVKEAYEKGFSAQEISKKFNITTKAIGDKARGSKWEIKSNINSELNELVASSQRIISNANNEEIKEMIEEKINTLAEDNELIKNNRKLLKFIQGVIVKNKEDITLKNIKSVTSAVLDIEKVANPTSNSINLNTQNNTQVQKVFITKEEQEVVRQHIEDFING